MQYRRIAGLAALAASAVLFAAPRASAQFVQIPLPTGSYTSSTTLIPITGPDFTTMSSLSDGTETILFTPSVDARTVPSSWGTWGSPPFTEGNTPRVDFDTTNSEILKLSVPASIFGFEAEPNDFGAHAISAVFKNGATVLGTITQPVTGLNGARLFAAQSSTPITEVDVTADSFSNGFAMGQFRYTAVPEPGSLALLGGCTSACFGMLLRRRRVRKTNLAA